MVRYWRAGLPPEVSLPFWDIQKEYQGLYNLVRLESTRLELAEKYEKNAGLLRSVESGSNYRGRDVLTAGFLDIEDTISTARPANQDGS